MLQNKISVILITGNEEENIRDCLKSVSWAGEIIVVASESVVNTIEIAKEFQKEIILIWGNVDENIRSKLGDNTTIIELISFFRDDTESIENIELGIFKACDSIIQMIK